MIMPVYVYGHPILRKRAVEVSKDYKGLNELIENMWETMKSEGVGLAAPQVGVSIRLFVIDSTPFAEDYPDADGFRKVFINAEITERKGEDEKFNEGCLSLPGIREDVVRKTDIHIKYYDENFVLHEEDYSGIKARIIQHEYDHIEGKLFIDHLSAIRRQLIKPKLNAILQGKMEVKYKVKWPKK